MYDKGAVIAGLAVFVVLFSFPFWYNTGSAAYKQPQPELPKNNKYCVESKDWMRAEHMQLLNDWRDEVVREGMHEYTSTLNGEHFQKSLVKTCMKCHESKEKFCDKCHDTLDVNPYCWDCHVAPKEAK
jgi:hypothetical protein